VLCVRFGACCNRAAIVSVPPTDLVELAHLRLYATGWTTASVYRVPGCDGGNGCCALIAAVDSSRNRVAVPGPSPPVDPTGGNALDAAPLRQLMDVHAGRIQEFDLPGDPGTRYFITPD
jgi:hypothetical protein